jgi:hypothetical protein
MIEQTYGITKEEQKKAKAALQNAKNLGLIDRADFEALEERRKKKNEEIAHRLKQGEVVYGLVSYSPCAYLQYELTRFKLDFVEKIEKIRENYVYQSISEQEKRDFYRENLDLFTRYAGDLFSYEEVEIIIEKRLREAEYEALINQLLCKL